MADPELQKRLETFSNGRKKSRTSGMGVGALAVALGLGGGAAAYWLASSAQDDPGPLETSQVETFQDGQPGGGRLEFPPEEAEQRVNDALIAVEDALVVPNIAPTEPSSEVLEEIARLREALAASQSERNSEIQAAVSDLRDAFDAQTGALEHRITGTRA